MIGGIERLTAGLAGRIARAEEAVSAEMALIAAETAALARETAPEGQPPRREPRLKDSFSVESGHLRAVARVTNPHAAYVEFGTGQRGAASGGAGGSYDADWPGMAARPYMAPAATAARAVFSGRLAAALRNGMRGDADDHSAGQGQ